MPKKQLIVNTKNSKIKSICSKVFRFFKNYFPIQKIVIIDFVEPRTIRRLKKQIWGINVFTDTITLIYDDSVQIYLCLDIIRQNAKKIKHPFYKELSLVLIHSLLHAVGKDESEAKKIQDMIFSDFYGEK